MATAAGLSANLTAYSEPRCARQASVLLVDDDVDNLMLLSFILEQFPCTIVCETDGKAALERINQTRFDLIMLDIQLPGISGTDLVRMLRTNPLNASLPVIAVTALARKQDQEEILRAGCDRYISKPYMVDDLEALIGQYITPLQASA
ncbi:MAG: response regulator [Leptolyngbyaceae bacterium]|nr:response regulator [Leptolyngbyaceae bacterium]